MKRLISLLFVLISLSILVASCQKAPFVSLSSPWSFTFTRDGGTEHITFTCNRDWRVTSSESWIQVSPSSGTASGGEVTVQITCAPNSTYDPRSATVTVQVEDLSETISISQDTGIGLIVSSEKIDLTNAAQTLEIEVQQNVLYSISIDDAGKDWVTQISDTQTRALSTDKVVFAVAENNGNDRDAYILFRGNGMEQSVHVVQSGCPLIVSASTLVADCLDGATLTIQVKAAGHWTVTEKGSSILNLSKNKGDAGSSSLTVSFNGANCTNANRMADLEFLCEGLSETIQLNQVPAFRFDSLEHTIPSTGGNYMFYFHVPRSFSSSEDIQTHDYDNGFYQLLNYEGENKAPDGVFVGEDASDANSVDTYMRMMYNFKANYAKTDRTGGFRLSFTENGQTLVSEWIKVIQPGDPYAGDETDGIPTVLQQHSKGSGVPLVILGDGFTKADILSGTFAAAAGKAYDYFFSVEPVTSLREYFDVWSVSAVSSSHSFDGSTRFGSTFTGGTHIEGNIDAAFRYASQVVPSNKTNDMLIIVVMNSTRYAGTCYFHYVDRDSNRVLTYSVAFVPMSEQSGMTFEDVIHHEACGHGLGKLADEYTGNGTIPDSQVNKLEVYQRAGAYVNVDLHAKVGSTSWADYAADSRFGYEKIGAYEGGFSYDSGVYRPTRTSIMDSNKGIFNAPSRAQIYKRVMGIANDWNWTFDYESFVSFDAPFRSENYNSSSTMTVRQNYVEKNDFVPLAPPVFVKQKTH